MIRYVDLYRAAKEKIRDPERLKRIRKILLRNQLRLNKKRERLLRQDWAPQTPNKAA